MLTCSNHHRSCVVNMSDIIQILVFFQHHQQRHESIKWSLDGGSIINCPVLPVPLVGVGKLIMGSVFHTWMLKRTPTIVSCGVNGLLPDATSGGQQAQPKDVTRPKWSAGCRRRLIGWIQINNHSDYLDGWLVGEKITNFPDSEGGDGWLECI